MAATERALAAAFAVAREHGVRPDEPVVVRDLTNLIVYLRPAPVVARVARTFSEHRGVEWVRTQVELSQYLADAGAAVAAPADAMPPGPHVRDGFIVTFWRWYDHDPARDVEPAEVGRLLRELHGVLAGFPGELPSYLSGDELPELLERLEAAGEDIGPLRAAVDDVERVSVPSQPVHGDAHVGNLLRTPDGPLWTDFEAACIAPREYDLACVAWTDVSFPERPPSFPAVARGYGDYDADVFERMLEAYGLFNTAWTIELVRRLGRGADPIRDARLGWWKARYGG